MGPRGRGGGAMQSSGVTYPDRQKPDDKQQTRIISRFTETTPKRFIKQVYYYKHEDKINFQTERGTKLPGQSITPPTAQLQKMQEKGGHSWEGGGLLFTVILCIYALY